MKEELDQGEVCFWQDNLIIWHRMDCKGMILEAKIPKKEEAVKVVQA